MEIFIIHIIQLLWVSLRLTGWVKKMFCSQRQKTTHQMDFNPILMAPSTVKNVNYDLIKNHIKMVNYILLPTIGYSKYNVITVYVLVRLCTVLNIANYVDKRFVEPKQKRKTRGNARQLLFCLFINMSRLWGERESLWNLLLDEKAFMKVIWGLLCRWLWLCIVILRKTL